MKMAIDSPKNDFAEKHRWLTYADEPDTVYDGSKIIDGSVTTEKLADYAVTTDKIDDESVTLSKLDADVLNLVENNVKAFDTVADMQSATLEAGNICHTNGFHAVSDGGAAFYKIAATGTTNGMDVLACDDVFANLVITESYVTPEMFGAWGDGIHDDTTVIQRMFDKFDGSEYVISGCSQYAVKELVAEDIVVENLSLIAVESCSYVIRCRSRHSIFNHLQIDGNNLADYGMSNDITGNDSNNAATINDFKITQCLVAGIDNKLRCLFNRGHISLCNVAILNTATDVSFNNIAAKNCTIGYQGTMGNVAVNHLHHWGDPSIINKANSIMFDMTGNCPGGFIRNCVCDGIRYFLSIATNKSWVEVEGLNWIMSADGYPSNLDSPKLLKNPSYGFVTFSNCLFNNFGVWKDSNDKLPDIFENPSSRCTITGGYSMDIGGNPFNRAGGPPADELSLTPIGFTGFSISYSRGDPKRERLFCSLTLPSGTYSTGDLGFVLKDTNGNNLIGAYNKTSVSVQIQQANTANEKLEITPTLEEINNEMTVVFALPSTLTVSAKRYYRALITIERF